MACMIHYEDPEAARCFLENKCSEAPVEEYHLDKVLVLEPAVILKKRLQHIFRIIFRIFSGQLFLRIP